MSATTTQTSHGVIVHDTGKLALLALVIVGMFAALMTHVMTAEAVLPMLTLVVGYLIGNGVNAARQAPGSPVLVSRAATPALVVNNEPDRIEPEVAAAWVDPGWPLGPTA